MKALAFDYGGVLIGDAFVALSEYEAEVGLPDGALCAEFRGGPLFSQCEVGQLSVRDFFDAWGRQVRRQHGLDPVPKVREFFKASTAVNTDVTESGASNGSSLAANRYGEAPGNGGCASSIVSICLNVSRSKTSMFS